MSTEKRSALKEVMILAWQFVRQNGYDLSKALKCAWANIKLHRALKARIVKFYFQKVDGSIREAFGTLRDDLLPETKNDNRRAEGWYLRQDIIWKKPSVMPESVKDRCTKSHEYIFLLSKSKRYYFDNRSIAEPVSTFDNIVRERKTSKLNNTPGRTPMKGLVRNNYTTKNKRSVWTVSTKPFKGAHFAVFPEQLVEPCIKAGCPEYGIVLDPFMGSGTTAVVARKLGRNFIGTELNPRFVELAKERLKQELGLFI